METSPHVNERILPSMIKIRCLAVRHCELIVQISWNNISNSMHLNFPFDLAGHRLMMASNATSDLMLGGAR
jgi:hypothetical protein